MLNPDYYQNYGIQVGMKLFNKLWWRFMPGTTIKVKWPVGPVTITENDPRWPPKNRTSVEVVIESADPNDHYRGYLEKYVGRQGWDWDWTLNDEDIFKDVLTIKFRRGKAMFASSVGLMWS
jgi:hypothetical protein